MLVTELSKQSQTPILLEVAREQQHALQAADGDLRRRAYADAADQYDAIASESQEWLANQGAIDTALHERAMAMQHRDEMAATGVAPALAERQAADQAWERGTEAFEDRSFDVARTEWAAAKDGYRASIVAHLIADARADAANPDRALAVKLQTERVLELEPGHAEAIELRSSAMAVIEFENAYGMSFVRIPAGQFMMGTPNGQDGRLGDETLHPVQLTRAFSMQTTEVTQAQWEAVMGYNPSAVVGPRLPVENVTWEMAQAFCIELSALTGHSYRLPTEAEWEYACRAGSRGPWAGEDLAALAWFNQTSERKMHAVGQLAPNAWGLYDMHGNVAEWCQDTLVRYPGPGQQRIDPVGRPTRDPRPDTQRAVRGGGFASNWRDVRSARRAFANQGRTAPSLGFRVVLDGATTE